MTPRPNRRKFRFISVMHEALAPDTLLALRQAAIAACFRYPPFIHLPRDRALPVPADDYARHWELEGPHA